jgi:hypothetical protein
MRRPTLALSAAALVVGLAALPSSSTAGVPGVVDPTVAAARDADVVVLTGKDLGAEWSAPQNLTARAPGQDYSDCSGLQPGEAGDPTGGGAAGAVAALQGEGCPHNHYAPADADTSALPVSGTPVDRILGYRWDAKTQSFKQIPFQVDEVFTRYLNNQASGFSPYSGEDEHTTYAFDREGFRFTKSDPADVCKAIADSPTATDPVKGLDTNDELAFMYSDAGPHAVNVAKPPRGVRGFKIVSVTDPTNPDAPTRYVYVARTDGTVTPAFTAANGYVRYQRDANADTFEHSESSYENYGNAAVGTYCDANGNPTGTGRRRPRDGATITTPRYRYRYDGRWLMTQIQISAHDDWTYGADLVDRWKARAFAQDPGSETPCCGYEEEDTNWGGSSTLLGERSGPVRTIRETWGADSGTNVVRRETFYRDRMVQKTWLRVHVIPPLDGIYAQWDFNAGRVDRFYNAQHPDGVAVDGVNDEVYGNFDDPCNDRWADDGSQVDATYRSFYKQLQLCQMPYHQSVDSGDATFADANASLGWSEITGPHGTIVDRIHATATDLTPGGAAQSLAAVPYYRDDACFDDGTGSNPGPVMNLRSADESKTASDGTARRCWKATDGDVDGDDHFFQGSIGTHGLHLLFQADSDNARLTKPVDEIVTDWEMTMLPGGVGNVGEQYGRSFEKPLVPVVGDRYVPGKGDTPGAP